MSEDTRDRNWRGCKMKCENIGEHLSHQRIDALKAQLAEANDLLAKAKWSLGEFTEYFGAIESGEYANNRRAPPLRDFEMVIIMSAKERIDLINNFLSTHKGNAHE